MKIKVAAENMLKNLGLEIHTITMDSFDEIQQLNILTSLMQLNKDMLQAELIRLELNNQKPTVNEEHA